MLKKLILSLLTSLLLTIPWLGYGGWTLFFAFVPLFILQTLKPRFMGLWVLLSFVLWIVMSTWWVAIATPIAAFAIPLVGLFFCWIPFMIYHYVRRTQSGHLAWVVFVTAWIAFEALYAYQDISFPWLTLGNGFAQMPWAVQWYEYTGTFGGTFWVLISNVLIFNLWQERRSIKRIAAAAVWVVVPLVWSYCIYVGYDEQSNPLKVCVVQPNFDPYSEKFGDQAMTQQQQTEQILALASESQTDVDFIITPETSFGNSDLIWLGNMETNTDISYIREFIKFNRPRATLIAGAVTFEPSGEQVAHYNSALWIDSTQTVEVYHKSKLVVGAELTPYPELFNFLSIDLGGISGNYGRQAHRSVYRNVGVAICYESIYGAYVADYVLNGAQTLFIITNDGWWGDTRGYHHHLSYARLRAIETRRSIARSANTGISAIINQRGDVEQHLGWDSAGALNGTVNQNSELTIYVQYKDIIVRLSVYVLALSLLYYVGQRYRQRGGR